VHSSASIEDVARLAGVSIATVSRSLRGLPEVAPATRARVLDAARELDYVASPFAARLASGRTSTMGVVVPFVNRWFFAEVLGAIQGVLGDADCDLLLFNLAGSAGREKFFAELPVRKRVDSVIIVSLALTESEEDTMRGLGLPVGLIGNTRPGFDCVGIDDIASAEMAVDHLIAIGHRRIGLIGGDTADPMRFTPPLHRRDGYLNALRRADLHADPADEALGYFTVDGGEKAMDEILSRADRPTAVFAESDEMAFGAIRAVRRHGLTVPGDMAVVGFDDHASARLLDLSTVSQPVAEQARIIARAMLVATESGASGKATVLPTRLVVRGSTDPAATTY
jgi:LacI family transcriptional regulator, repressor for deo operon, udp, cdd, tsx, nupC, and nupG